MYSENVQLDGLFAAAARDYRTKEQATSFISYSCIYPFYLIAPFIIVPKCHISRKCDHACDYLLIVR